MASTYSTSLRLELIGTGDQSGTWGDTTNTNLGTLLEQAIGGYVSIVMTDANYTLTTANGASDEARNMVVRMTGILTATRNVNCPNGIEKLYLVINDTTGSQSIVFKTASGTGVTIANGKRALVYVDGTNAVSAYDSALISNATITDSTFTTGTFSGTIGSLSGGTISGTTISSSTYNGTIGTLSGGTISSTTYNGTIGTLSGGTISSTTYNGTIGTLSGGTISGLASPLAVASGGTGATTSTGSGSVVLASSPTLTTPDLGTPSAAVLTNATALPLTTGVTGTLGASNGGTGLSSYTIGDLLYASGATALSKLADVATGNSLLSGGVGVAPSWGKIGLTTHVSGTLPVANGGTGVTTSTGSGAVVLASSPTLTTPNLGTPSALVLTNATGTPASIDLSNATSLSLTTGITGTLGASNGGTGLSSYTVGDLLYASGTGALSKLADVATGNSLISGGIGVAPSWGKIGLTTHVSGTLPVANGGTGATTSTGSGAVVLASSPTLTTPNLGTPSTLVLSNATDLPLTTGVTGTLPVANGGTGQSSYTTGDLLYASGTGALSKLSDVATGSALISGGIGIAPSWGKVGLTTHVSGTLPVANGGTGGTTSTGSGAVVLASSPTLTTPNLGTPSALVLTNASGLPLTTGVTGTLPVANGGTGATTSTGSGSVVLASSPTLTTPNLGTPSALVLTNASSLPLSTGVTGTLPVGNGGTGATTLTGLVKGNGASAFTAAVAGTDYAGISNTNTFTVNQSISVTDNTDSALLINQAGTAPGLAVQNGSVVIGATTTSYELEVYDAGAATTAALRTQVNNGNASVMRFDKARGGSGGATIIQNNDDLGSVRFHGYDGAAYIEAARITGEVDGTPGASGDVPGAISFSTRADGGLTFPARFIIDSAGNTLNISSGGLGYGSGSGGSIPQTGSRTNGVSLNKTNGAITLVNAAGSTSWQSFTVTNSTVAATDTIIVNQKSGTDLYEIHVTAVAAGSFRISFRTTAGATTEQPVFNFAVIKAVIG